MAIRLETPSELQRGQNQWKLRRMRALKCLQYQHLAEYNLFEGHTSKTDMNHTSEIPARLLGFSRDDWALHQISGLFIRPVGFSPIC